uniref:HTH cro/C1-type domain-containing protein n=1 Tax=Marinomonas sp. (strain MWYL1) TaxID=400668 RepID=A6VSR5_MARMS
MTNENLTPKKWIGKKKEGEIYRFQLFLAEKNINPEQIQIDTGVTARTVTNSIYEGKPLGAKLLREIHAKYGVSIDWLVSGKGRMFVDTPLSHLEISESRTDYKNDDPRYNRIVGLVQEFMANANEDEAAWLETQMKFNISQFKQFLNDQ